jgi:hypothetical protein
MAAQSERWRGCVIRASGPLGVSAMRRGKKPVVPRSAKSVFTILR